MEKILKLTSYDGEDFGYVGMKKDKFIGGVDKSEATKFKLEEYPKDNSAYYYQVIAQPKHYLDIKFTSSVLFSDRVNFAGLSVSSIVAWKQVNGELHAILGGRDTTKVLSRSAADPDSKMLYGNLLMGDGAETVCKVELIDV
jgi:hypothetical protein